MLVPQTPNPSDDEDKEDLEGGDVLKEIYRFCFSASRTTQIPLGGPIGPTFSMPPDVGARRYSLLFIQRTACPGGVGVTGAKRPRMDRVRREKEAVSSLLSRWRQTSVSHPGLGIESSQPTNELELPEVLERLRQTESLFRSH